MDVEEVLTGGDVNQVSRRGDIVYRSGGPWTPTIQSLLATLQRRGFTRAPRPLGVDDQGREMISFMPGEPMLRPWRPVMFGDEALLQAGAMLRELHAATIDLTYPDGTAWRSRVASKIPSQVVRHGDLGPWNTLWSGDTLTGLIDWDFAEPGEAVTDLAQMALYFVPLRGEDDWRDCGFPARPDFGHRIAALCDAYGAFTPDEVVREVERLQRASIEEIVSRAAEGRYPWTMFRDNGEVERTRTEVAWLRNTLGR